MSLNPVRLSRYERVIRSFSGDPLPKVYLPHLDRGVASHYLTIKISQMIHDTVICSLTNRSEADWVHAEVIVRDHFSWLLDRVTGVVKGDTTLPDGCSYEEFERTLGRTVWENARNYRTSLPHPPYGDITFY